MSEESGGERFDRLVATEELLEEWREELDKKAAMPVLLVGIIQHGHNRGDPVITTNYTDPELMAKFLQSLVDAIRDPQKLVHERRGR